jgi:hypothetical protein
MLRLDNDGSIRLTIHGQTVAKISPDYTATITAKELVQWENYVRLAFYEKCNGFYSQRNQRLSRDVEISDRMRFAYPLATIQPLEEFNAYWDQKREEAIDN